MLRCQQTCLIALLAQSLSKDLLPPFTKASAFHMSSNTHEDTKTAGSERFRHCSSHLYDRMSDLESPNTTPVYWFHTVTSTMDKAKELIKSDNFSKSKVFAVVAANQTKGRGTRGRSWISDEKNLQITIVIDLNSIPISLNYIPLRVGTILANSISSRVTSGSPVKLKWPNDILIGDKKVCGILIEIENDKVVIGIGCNIANTPTVPQSGSDFGRQATSLADHNDDIASVLDAKEKLLSEEVIGNMSDLETAAQAPTSDDLVEDGPNHAIKTAPIDGTSFLKAEPEQSMHDNFKSSAGLLTTTRSELRKFFRTGDIHYQIAQELADEVHTWIEIGRSGDSANQVLEDFSRNMDYSIQRLRPTSAGAKVVEGDSRPVMQEVKPLFLNSDGTLQVEFVQTGEQGTLIAEYMW